MDLRDWMKENRWSMSAIEKKTGITKQTIRSLMDKKPNVSLRSAMSIVKFTKGEVSFQDLAGENDKNEKRDNKRKKDENPFPADIAI